MLLETALMTINKFTITHEWSSTRLALTYININTFCMLVVLHCVLLETCCMNFGQDDCYQDFPDRKSVV